MEPEYITMKEAGEYLAVSKSKMWQLVKQGILPCYSDPLDKRKRLVKREDLEKLTHPQKL